MSETVKKKRGRKPKNKIILNENPIFDSNGLDDILITCIKKPIAEINVKSDVEPSEQDYDNNFMDYDSGSINNKCWNCSHNIKHEVYSYPTSYHNGTFHVNGNFCCYECASRYIYETFNDREFWDKYYLLNFYVNTTSGKDGKINIPYSKLRLKEYGGDLTKEEYIKSQNITYDCYVPPTIYVNNTFCSKYNHINNGSEFKLFRKNKKTSKFDLIYS